MNTYSNFEMIEYLKANGFNNKDNIQEFLKWGFNQTITLRENMRLYKNSYNE